MQRRHFLAVLGVAACSSTPTTMSCTPTPPGGDGGDDVTETDASGDVPVPVDTPPVDVPAACMTAGVRVAAVTDLAVGAYRLVQQRPSILVILGRDDHGFFAYSARCTHTGCTVPAPAGPTALSSCPCHFSRFDAQGRVQPGSMARLNLDHFAVTVCEGGVYVDRTRVVPVDTRAAAT